MLSIPNSTFVVDELEALLLRTQFAPFKILSISLGISIDFPMM